MSWGPTQGQAFRKLTQEQVVAIRQLWLEGASYGKIGAVFGATAKTVQNVVCGKSYALVPGWFSAEERAARNARFGVHR